MAVSALVVLLCVTVTCVTGESAPFYGVTVGPLSTFSHRVSGTVYIVDEKRIRIKQFVYDGQGPAAYFWGGQRGVSGSRPDQSGVTIPDENGGREKLGRYDNVDVVLTLPPPLTAENIRWLSVWCEEFSVNFGSVAFPANVQVPRPTVIGQFSDEEHGVSSGNVTVLDVNTVNVKAFTCSSCSQSEAQFVIGFFQATSEMVTFQQSNGGSGSLDGARGVRVSLTVPDPNTVMDFDFIAVYSSDNNVTLARIAVPSPLRVPPNLSGSSTYYGVSVGRLPTLAHDVTGDVYIVNSKHFLIKNFVYDGTAPAAYFWVGDRTANPTPDQATGMAVPDETNRLTRAYTNEDVIVTLPESLDVDDILWLSVWCIAFQMDFGHVILPENVPVPRPTVIGQLSDAVYGVSSGAITVVDSSTITVESFTCDCSQTGIQFVGDRGMGMTGSVVRLEHPNTPYENLDSASQLSVDLAIPQPNNVHDFQMLAVHSFRNDRTLASITLPSTLVVPPYFGRNDTTGPGVSGAGPCKDHNTVSTLLATAVVYIWWWVKATGQ